MKLDFDGIRLQSPFYDETHREWRDSVVRPFIDKEIVPHIEKWEKIIVNIEIAICQSAPLTYHREVVKSF